MDARKSIQIQIPVERFQEQLLLEERWLPVIQDQVAGLVADITGQCTAADIVRDAINRAFDLVAEWSARVTDPDQNPAWEILRVQSAVLTAFEQAIKGQNVVCARKQ